MDHQEYRAGGHEGGDGHAADRVRRVADQAADAGGDGNEKKAEDDNEDRREEIGEAAGHGAGDWFEFQQGPHHGHDDGRADDHDAHGHVAFGALHGGETDLLGANVFQSSAERGKNCGERFDQGDQAGSGDCARAHGANVAAPQILRGHQRDGNGGGIERLVAAERAEEFNGGHDDQPGNDAAGKQGAGNFGADDVTDAEIFGGHVGAKGRAGQPLRLVIRLAGPHPHGVHGKSVEAAEAEAPKHAAGEGAAAFARDENVGASRAFGESEIAVFLYDELAAQRNHEEGELRASRPSSAREKKIRQYSELREKPRKMRARGMEK